MTLKKHRPDHFVDKDDIYVKIEEINSRIFSRNKTQMDEKCEINQKMKDLITSIIYEGDNGKLKIDIAKVIENSNNIEVVDLFMKFMTIYMKNYKEKNIDISDHVKNLILTNKSNKILRQARRSIIDLDKVKRFKVPEPDISNSEIKISDYLDNPNSIREDFSANQEDNTNFKQDVLNLEHEFNFKIIYIDGSFKNDIASVGIFFPNSPDLNISTLVPEAKTNNQAELHAILTALNFANKSRWKSLEIRSDSAYSIKAIRHYIESVVNNKPSSLDGFKNLDLISKIVFFSQSFNINWVHVPRLSPGLMEAHKLASKAMEKFPPQSVEN